MACLPSSYSNYLAPTELHVTLSIRSCSSAGNDDSSFCENVVERSAPSTPKRSGPHNLRREGYSEEKCRYVLVKYCSSIPRNFNYAEGVQLVYEKLREHCGDENLDLSIGVLYEFIEVDTQFTFEEGAAFRRWQFDHSRRAGDLTNNHAPRMGNIIVGNVIPTERLRQWRSQNPHRQRYTNLSDFDSAHPASPSLTSTVSPHFGILHRSAWHIENTLYVSSMHEGTRVHYCPTAQELHERAWNETYGRGGKFIRQRRVGPDAMKPLEFPQLDTTKPHKKKKVIEIFFHSWTGSVLQVLKIRLPREALGPLSTLRDKIKCAFHRHQAYSVPLYEGLEEVLNLPEQDTKEGREYYRNIRNTDLPDDVEIPNSMFARKHDLYNEANEAHAPSRMNRMRSVEDFAIEKCLEATYEAETFGTRWTYRGPLTASLFKDGGIDYQWEVLPVQKYRSDVIRSGDSHFSFDEERPSELPVLRIPPAPARSQRARSQSRRALQGGNDIIQHDSIEVTVDESCNDAARPYATWRRSGTEAHLFSGSTSKVIETSSESHFDRFAAHLQSRFNTPKSKQVVRTRGLDQPIQRSEVGIRKRTVDCVKARKQLFKKIVTFDGIHEPGNEVVIFNEKDLLPATTFSVNNNHNENNNNLNTSEHQNKTRKSVESKQGSSHSSSFLRSPLIHKVSIVLDYNISAPADQVSADHEMESSLDGASGPIQINGKFMLGSPQPLTIRKLSEEYLLHQNASPSRQKQHTALESTKEEDHLTEQHPPHIFSHRREQSESSLHQYPPRTSSRHQEDSPSSAQRQPSNKSSHHQQKSVEMNPRHRLRHRANTSVATANTSSSGRKIHDAAEESFMGNFMAIDASMDTPPTTSHSNRKKADMNDAAARYRHVGRNPYEYEDDVDDKHLTTVTTVEDFLQHKFGSNTAIDRHEVVGRPLNLDRDIARKAAGHVKNSNSEHHPNQMAKRYIPETSTARPNDVTQRPEYQQEFTHGYGRLHRVKSSPAIGALADPAPNPSNDSYVAYKNYEGHDRDPDRNYYSGSTYLSGNDDTPLRGRKPRPRGLGINSVELDENYRDDYDHSRITTRDGEKDFDDSLDDPFAAPKRSRSPIKRLFGPGGLLGNTGALNSPADPRYVKPKNMITKIKSKFETLAEIPRSISPIRNPIRNPIKNSVKTEEKAVPRSKFPVSLSPPRQAKLYAELELLICTTSNHFLMEQWNSGRVTAESLKKIKDFWKSKGRAQVIEFQYDQATQRDLICLNQRNFRFHGDKASNVLQVNAMLYSWRENAREMSIRTFCVPDTVMQKQLHDTYKLLELLGAPLSTFLALQNIHSTFNRYIKKAEDARQHIEAIKNAHGVERKVVSAEARDEPQQSSQSRGIPQNISSAPQSPMAKMYDVDRAVNPPCASESSRRPTDDTYPRNGLKFGSGDGRTVNKDRSYKSYSDQSDITDEYYISRVNGLRRARNDSQGQKDHQRQRSKTSYSSQIADARSQNGHNDSSNSYSSKDSGSRNLPDHNSTTSYQSHTTSSRGQPQGSRGSNPNSERVIHTRAQNGHNRYGSSASHPSNDGSYHDGMTNRNREISQDLESNRGATRSRRGVQDDDDSDDDFTSFGKYAAGL